MSLGRVGEGHSEVCIGLYKQGCIEKVRLLVKRMNKKIVSCEQEPIDHECFSDILNRDMLKLGSSMPWPDAMEKITGQREMSALPLVKYFEPLMRYLEEENARMGETIGWPNTEWKPEGN